MDPAIAARIEGTHELGMLGNGFAQWLRRADEKRDADAKLRRSIGFLKNRLAAYAWAGWCALVVQAALDKDAMPSSSSRLDQFVGLFSSSNPLAIVCFSHQQSAISLSCEL